MTIEKKSAQKFLMLMGCDILSFISVLFVSAEF